MSYAYLHLLAAETLGNVARVKSMGEPKCVFQFLCCDNPGTPHRHRHASITQHVEHSPVSTTRAL